MKQIREYKIEVRAWMLKKSSPDFDFMTRWNNDIPMPLMMMYGYKVAETRGMIKMKLHGDLKDKITQRCMMCGKVITHPVSKFFGIGPKCGGHQYINPFDTDEELKAAVDAFRFKLVNTTWTGWIPKSAITRVDDILVGNYDQDIFGQMELHSEEDPANKKAEPVEPKVEVKQVDSKPSADIIATVDKPNRGTEEYSVYLQFRYNETWKDAIKSLPVRFWDNGRKQWEILYSELADLQEMLYGVTFEIIGDDKVQKSITDIPVEFSYKTTPYNHQVEGLEYGLTHDRWLLCDQQGLGKTKQLIDLAVARKFTDGFKHCLIICGVNGLKWNWVEEIATHSNEGAFILGQRDILRGINKGKKRIGSNQDKLEDAKNLNSISEYFIITNVETLRNSAIVEVLAKACEDNIIGLVAIDEFHMCRNTFAAQSRGVLQLQPKYRVGMTGTPLMNTPMDFYQIFKWLGYQPYDYKQFRSHFCIFGEYNEVVGYKNYQDIEKVLNKIMLRRTKEEVLDLPEKVYITEYVELSSEQQKNYRDAFEIAKAKLDLDTEYNPLSEIIRLRQVTGNCGPFENLMDNPKLDRLVQLVEEAINQDDKVVIFSQWTEMIKLIQKRLANFGTVTITGNTKDNERQAIVNKFQNDPNTKVFIGSIGAVGVGITLTAASTVIFTDEPWTYGAYEQCVDRCHRIGTTKTVTVHTIIAHDTIDEVVHDIVTTKKDLAERFTDKSNYSILKNFIFGQKKVA